MDMVDSSLNNTIGLLSDGLQQPQITKSMILQALLRGQQPPSFNDLAGQGQGQQPPAMQPMQQQTMQPPGGPRLPKAIAQQAQMPPPQQMPPQQQMPQAAPQQQMPQQPQQEQPTLLERQADDLMQRRQALYEREAEAAKPVSHEAGMAAYQRQLEGSDQALIRSLAASQANMGPLAQHFMHEAATLREPVKTAGGVYGPGGFIEDVDRTAEQASRRLQAQIGAVEAALQQNLTQQDRGRLQQQQRDLTERLATLQRGQANVHAQIASGDRRFIAEQAHQDRVADREQRAATAVKGNADPQAIIDLVGQARKYLPKATGSGAGTLVDQAANFVGYSTEGAEATAQLNAIGGKLVGAQPRFEGPQSDADVKLYQRMAGDVANSTLPIKVRAAALQAIEDLAKGYQSGALTPTTPPRPAQPRAPAAAASPVGRSEKTAVNPTTGETLVLRNGQWVKP